MAFLTEARARATASTMSTTYIRQELMRFRNLPSTAKFDVFLSHSFMDAAIIYGVKELLEATGVTVYVDWIEDNQLDRSRVNAKTADLLRTRMRNSRSLYYAASDASRESRWMPWELGFFDGIRPGHVAILPIVRTDDEEFQGQEYLGLYPQLEYMRSPAARHRLAFRTDKGQVSVKEFTYTALSLIV